MPPESSAAPASTSNSSTNDNRTSDKPNSDEQNIEENKLHELLEATKKALECQDVFVPSHCEKFILRCIRVKNYNVKKAAALVTNYRQMLLMPELSNVFHNFSPNLLRGLYENKTIYPLAKRGPKGQMIIVGHAGSWEPSDYDFDQAIAGMIVLFNFCVANSVQTQEEGVIFVFDCSGWSIKMIKAIKVNRLIMVMQLVQSSTPGKVKAIHLINYPRVVKLIFMMVKPFMKSKMLNRIHFHGDGTTSLREELDFLPESLGGIAEGDSVDKELLETLFQQEQYYRDLIKFIYPAY